MLAMALGRVRERRAGLMRSLARAARAAGIRRKGGDATGRPGASAPPGHPEGFRGLFGTRRRLGPPRLLAGSPYGPCFPRLSDPRPPPKSPTTQMASEPVPLMHMSVSGRMCGAKRPTSTGSHRLPRFVTPRPAEEGATWRSIQRGARNAAPSSRWTPRSTSRSSARAARPASPPGQDQTLRQDRSSHRREPRGLRDN